MHLELWYMRSPPISSWSPKVGEIIEIERRQRKAVASLRKKSIYRIDSLWFLHISCYRMWVSWKTIPSGPVSRTTGKKFLRNIFQYGLWRKITPLSKSNVDIIFSKLDIVSPARFIFGAPFSWTQAHRCHSEEVAYRRGRGFTTPSSPQNDIKTMSRYEIFRSRLNTSAPIAPRMKGLRLLGRLTGLG